MFGNGSARGRAGGEVEGHAAEAVRWHGLAAKQLLLGCRVGGEQHAHPGVDVLGGAEIEVDAARVADLLPEELSDGDPRDAPDEFVHDGADRQPVISVRLARPPVRDLRREPGRHRIVVDDLLERELRLHPGNARLVRQRDADGDIPLAAAGELGPVTADRGVQVERALLDKQRDADRGDSLGA